MDVKANRHTITVTKWTPMGPMTFFTHCCRSGMPVKPWSSQVPVNRIRNTVVEQISSVSI